MITPSTYLKNPSHSPRPTDANPAQMAGRFWGDALLKSGRLFCLYLSFLLLAIFPSFGEESSALGLRQDDAAQRLAPRLADKSHINVFLPSIPYIYSSHAINAGFIRPANNDQGWQYDLATNITQVDDLTYDVTLRQGVKFQDGSAFDADAVLLNMTYFKKKPFLFTNIDKVYDSTEKLEPFKVRFHLKEKYGQFVNDLIWLHFYTEAYLVKYGWNGKATCPNLAAPGPYGLGPYILKEGYVEGDRHTPKIELEANPYYWDKRYPLVKSVTLYTELTTNEALNMALYEEKMDIAPIPFSEKIQTILSPYAKVVISPSTATTAIHLNLLNGNPRLRDLSVRQALNAAIDQSTLLKWTYDDEGKVAVIGTAPDFPGVRDVSADFKPYSERASFQSPNAPNPLQDLTLKVIAQERFLPLLKAIAFQLSKVDVRLQYDIVDSEKEVFAQLLTTYANQNKKAWDVLIWGDDDWYYNHPWSSFLVLRPGNYWSTIYNDQTLNDEIDELFRSKVGTKEFTIVTKKIMTHVYDNAYMLFAPAPNQIFSVNKEVNFTPYRMATMPLWQIGITKDHWSIRTTPYPDALKQPIDVNRVNF